MRSIDDDNDNDPNERYDYDTIGYNDRLKRRCMYDVLKKYSHLLRPGVYPDDTRTIFLMTMCRLIDLSKLINDRKNYNKNVTRENKGKDDDESNSEIDEIGRWALEELSYDDNKGLFRDNRSAAVPGPLSVDERIERLERVILDDNLNVYF